jgi:hypothetical protein
MQSTINRNLLRYAASTIMFCPNCRGILDMRRVVVITLSDQGDRTITRCCACWDALREKLLPLAQAKGVSLEVLDARDLFPPTLAEARAILRPLGITLSRRAEANEYRVNLAGGTEAQAYYASDINDAIGTGRAMAARAKEGK